MNTRNNIFLITALLYIFYTAFPLFADSFRIPVWLPSMVVSVIMIAINPKAFANKTFFWFLIYSLMLFLYLMINRPLSIGIGLVNDGKKILIEFAYVLPTIGIFCNLMYLNAEDVIKKLMIWSIGLLFVSFIVEVPLMQQYGSIRLALHEESEQVRIAGLPSYSLMHAYTLFLPVMLYGVKIFNGKDKGLALVGLLVLCIVIYSTSVTTSLLIMFASIIYTIIYSERNKVVFVCTILILYMLYKIGFFILLIKWMMPVFEGTAVEYKLNDFMASMLQGKITGSSIIGRMDYHAISWQSFASNPIFGTDVTGGHSSLLDRLGGMGLIVGLPYIMIFVSYIIQIRILFKTKIAKDFFWLGVISGVVYLYEKGLWDSECWLFYIVLMPMGLLYFETRALSK